MAKPGSFFLLCLGLLGSAFATQVSGSDMPHRSHRNQRDNWRRVYRPAFLTFHTFSDPRLVTSTLNANGLLAGRAVRRPAEKEISRRTLQIRAQMVGNSVGAPGGQT